jgi:hypothetical protein
MTYLPKESKVIYEHRIAADRVMIRPSRIGDKDRETSAPGTGLTAFVVMVGSPLGADGQALPGR